MRASSTASPPDSTSSAVSGCRDRSWASTGLPARVYAGGRCRSTTTRSGRCRVISRLSSSALAAQPSGLTPPWQRRLGVAGGGLLLAAGAANLAIADGAALVFVGLPGLAAWLVWLLTTGVRLVRARTADRPDNASTYDE